jgi:hypothetical protein
MNNGDTNIHAETDPETDVETDTETESTVSENTNFTDDSVSDSMSDSDDGTNTYEGNYQLNNCLSKNVLLIPEIYNQYFHGKTVDSDPNIEGQFLVLQSFYLNPNSRISDFFKYANNLCKFYKKYYEKNYYDSSLSHKLLRNYNNIIRQPNYLNLQIGRVYYLKGDECVCVMTTFWLKLVQRAWKRVYKMRKLIMQRRSRPDSIMYRQFSGKWLDNCKFMPSIRGMMMIMQ